MTEAEPLALRVTKVMSVLVWADLLLAIGWFPGMMALGFFFERLPLLPVGVLVLGIPLLLLAGLRGLHRT